MNMEQKQNRDECVNAERARKRTEKEHTNSFSGMDDRVSKLDCREVNK